MVLKTKDMVEGTDVAVERTGRSEAVDYGAMTKYELRGVRIGLSIERTYCRQFAWRD